MRGKKERQTILQINAYWQDFLENENDFQSFSFIYSIFVDDLLSYGISLGFNENICRDAVHDVFCKLLLERKKLPKIHNLTSFLFKATRNQLINLYKKEVRLANTLTDELGFSTEITILDSLINEEETERLKKTVEDLLNELTPRQREAIYLRYMQQLDYSEIADILNMNSNSARRLVHRGLSNLKSKSTQFGDLQFLTIIFLLYRGYF